MSPATRRGGLGAVGREHDERLLAALVGDGDDAPTVGQPMREAVPDAARGAQPERRPVEQGAREDAAARGERDRVAGGMQSADSRCFAADANFRLRCGRELCQRTSTRFEAPVAGSKT